MSNLRVVEICAGAGGQALGLHRAGFDHALAVELDENAARTLKANTEWDVAVGDVADKAVWDPRDYFGVDLLAGGVPCPPFSIAGKQLGSSDERDLFAWAVEQVGVMRPRALLLENVRGLAAARFSAYRQRVLDRLGEFGYVADWRLLQASDFGVAQLRPRFVLIAMLPQDAAFFEWPAPRTGRATVGAVLRDLMGKNGWPYADDWAQLASGIGPTLVGGSKKHGGADLGPTRAKQAWLQLAVDGKGLANEAPGFDSPHPSEVPPKLTVEMVARLQGWDDATGWIFTGGKTSQYRQIGNAFPPPVAEALGHSIRRALLHEGDSHAAPSLTSTTHDPIYRALIDRPIFVPERDLIDALQGTGSTENLRERIALLERDFVVDRKESPSGWLYRLGAFKGFIGQSDHLRHDYLISHRSRVS